MLKFCLPLLLLVGCAAMVKTGQFPKSLDSNSQYWLHIPESYNSSGDPSPLMLFLHGAGERGDDLELVKKHGPPMLADKDPDFPFVLISPQCPEDQVWDPEVLIQVLDEVIKNYRIDKTRVYLTGLSMGGKGTWDLAMAYPERFAAIAPICGFDPKGDLSLLRDIPTWVFHGKLDKVVSVNCSQEAAAQLQKVGGNVKLTIYPESDHDSWTETYNNPELYEWLLSHIKM